MSAAELRVMAAELLACARIMKTSGARLRRSEELMRRSQAAIAATRRQLAKAGR